MTVRLRGRLSLVQVCAFAGLSFWMHVQWSSSTAAPRLTLVVSAVAHPQSLQQAVWQGAVHTSTPCLAADVALLCSVAGDSSCRSLD